MLLLLACGRVEPASVQVISSADTLPADGRSRIVVSVTGTTEGAAPEVTVDPGAVVSVEPATDGWASATVQAGTWPGDVTFTVDGAVVTGVLELTPPTPWSVQLHTHGSLSEGNGNMAHHTAQAAETGVDVIWWTDHDFGYVPSRDMVVEGVDFESGELSAEVPGWPGEAAVAAALERLDGELEVLSVVTADAAGEGSYGWRLDGSSSGVQRSARYLLSVAPRIHFRSLLAGVTASLKLRPGRDADGAELWITFPLDARGAGRDEFRNEDYRRIDLYWSAEDHSALAGEDRALVRMDAPVGEWTDISVDLTAVALEAFPSVGVDQHIEPVIVEIRATDAAAFDIDALGWRSAVIGEDLRDAQRQLLEETAGLNDAGVQHLVGVEISPLPGGHLSAFGDEVPLIDYTAGGPWDLTAATGAVQTAGGLVSLNHLLGTNGEVFAEDERAALVKDAIDDLDAGGVYGVDLVEVGYRARVGELADFLEIWDGLSLRGHRLTGVGASDVHDRISWADMDNNFVTWVPAATAEADELLAALKRGAAWFGDPADFPDGISARVTAPAHRAVAGQVVPADSGTVTAHFNADPLRAGWAVDCVVDGAVAESWTVPLDGPFTAGCGADSASAMFVRFAVRDGDRGVLYTNPVFFGDDEDGARTPQP